MSLSCHRDYDEKTLRISSGTASAAGTHEWQSIRAYHDAHAMVRKGETELKPTLRTERSLIAVEVNGSKVTSFSPQGPLAIDELDLVTAAGESLAIDAVLPELPVKLHESWKVPDDALTAMLDLEEITENKVQMTLPRPRRPCFAPKWKAMWQASCMGREPVGTEGQMPHRSSHGRIDWFAMRVAQAREGGVVEPGLEVNLLVQMKIEPMEKCDALADAKLKDLKLKPTDELCRLQYAPTEGHWQVLHDRQWYLVEHFRDLDIFHRLDRGQDIGVCKISRLPPTAPTSLPTLARFQESVEKALGSNFASLVEAAQGVTEGGYRYYRVVAAGKDGEAPVQWVYYHVADDGGRQAAFAFRIEAKNLDTFAKADEMFLQTLRFTKEEARPTTQTGQRTTTTSK